MSQGFMKFKHIEIQSTQAHPPHPQLAQAGRERGGVLVPPQEHLPVLAHRQVDVDTGNAGPHGGHRAFDRMLAPGLPVLGTPWDSENQLEKVLFFKLS